MGGWPEGDKKEILSRLGASDCWLLVGKTVAATRLGRYSLHCSRLFRGQGCHVLWEWGLLWGALSVALKKGWSQGSPKLYGFESDTVSHFDKLITEQDHAVSGRWLHQRPGGQLRERESELFEVYISATGTASYVTCRGRESERERDWECMVKIANCEVFKKSILLFVNKGLPFDEIKSQQLVCPNMSLQLNLLVAN